MEESELLVRHDLGPRAATVNLADCRLSSHEQRSTGDIWCLATGPLGTFALPLVQRAIFARLLRHRLDPPDASPDWPANVPRSGNASRSATTSS